MTPRKTKPIQTKIDVIGYDKIRLSHIPIKQEAMLTPWGWHRFCL